MREYKKKLTKSQKKVLELYLHEYHQRGIAPNYPEMAKKLNTTKQNIYILLKRALKNIKNCPLCGQKIPL